MPQNDERRKPLILTTLEAVRGAHAATVKAFQALEALAAEAATAAAGLAARLQADLKPDAVRRQVADLRGGYFQKAAALLGDLRAAGEDLEASRVVWDAGRLLSRARVVPLPPPRTLTPGTRYDALTGSERLLIDGLDRQGALLAEVAEAATRSALLLELAALPDVGVLERLRDAAAEGDRGRVFLAGLEAARRGLPPAEVGAARAALDLSDLVEAARLIGEGTAYGQAGEALAEEVRTGVVSPAAKIALGLALADGQRIDEAANLAA